MVKLWSTMVNHGWPWSTMVTWPWSTMVSIVSMVDHAQPCFCQVDHGQTWSFSNLTMVDHGTNDYALTMLLKKWHHGWPWSHHGQHYGTIDHALTMLLKNGTMVSHGHWPWSEAWFLAVVPFFKSTVNHGLTMVKTHVWTMVEPCFFRLGGHPSICDKFLCILENKLWKLKL